MEWTTYEEAVNQYVKYFNPHYCFIIADKQRILKLIKFFETEGEEEKAEDLKELLVEQGFIKQYNNES